MYISYFHPKHQNPHAWWLGCVCVRVYEYHERLLCMCARSCVSVWWLKCRPHAADTLGDRRSVSLTTGVGKVSTLLADGDWLSPFLPPSQSTADPRHCFNHSLYGTVAEQAILHPAHSVLPASVTSPLLSISLFPLLPLPTIPTFLHLARSLAHSKAHL